MQSNYSGSPTGFAVLQIQCKLLLLLLSLPRSECPKLLNAHLLLHSSMTSPCFPNTLGTFTDSYLLMLVPLPGMTCVYFSPWKKSTHSSRSFPQHYLSLEGSLDTLPPRITLIILLLNLSLQITEAFHSLTIIFCLSRSPFLVFLLQHSNIGSSIHLS